jgi:hypothetical protein
MPFTKEQVAGLRDKKLADTMSDLAPIWMVNDEFRAREDALIFNLVFQDPSYGWMNRRFKYDGFNDVLYHLGWRLLSEDETLKVQETEPYIPGDIALHVPNAPSFRSVNGVPR